MGRGTRRRLIFAAATAGLAAMQTTRLLASESWVGPSGGSWSDPSNWIGAVPNNGDVPLFRFSSDLTDVILDLPSVTLDGIIFDSAERFRILEGTPGNSITLTGSATINAVQSNAGSPTLVPTGHVIAVTLSGSAGLNKIGDGDVTLGSNNNYSGGTTIGPGGALATIVGDGAFGQSSGSIILNGGMLRVANTLMNSARDVRLLSDSTIQALNGVVIGGIVNGSGALNKTGSDLLTLTNANSYSGATNVRSGSLILGNGGSILNSPQILAGGTVLLDNGFTNVSNRIADTASITFLGSALTVTGNGGAPTAETLGAATFNGGITFVSAQASVFNVSVTMASANRVDRGTVFFRGDDLGSAPDIQVGNIFFTAPPSLVGGGGANGTTNISIIPWAWGGFASNVASNNASNSFVTYGPNGVRPLEFTEYATSIGAGVSTNNVRLNSDTTVNTASTINSLLLMNSSAVPFTVSGSGTISVTSGAIMNLATVGTINTAVNFGAAEGIVHATSLFTMNGKISGSNGLTKSGGGSLKLTSSSSDYTGQTTLLAGDITYIGNVTAGSPGPLGSDSSAVVLAPGGLSNPGAGGFARLWAGAAGTTTFSRNLTVRGNPAGIAGFGTSGAFANQVVVMNGDIDVQTHLQFQGDPDSPMIINGTISGPGMLSDGFAAAQTLNGNNTYSGGTEIHDGQWFVGSNTALGSGTVWFATDGGRLAATVDDIELHQPVVILASPTINGTHRITLSAPIDLGGLTLVHHIDNTAVTTYAGGLMNGGLIKQGNGTLLLTSSSTYNGLTQIDQGVLQIWYGGSLGDSRTGTVVSGTGAALELANNNNNVQSMEPVTISATGIGATGAIRSLGGFAALGTVTLAADASIGVDSGTLSTGPISGGSFGFSKVGAGTLIADNYRVGAMTVSTGTARVLDLGGGTSKVTSLSIAAGATMDLRNHNLVIDYTGGSPVATVQQLLAQGRLTSSSPVGPTQRPGFVDNATLGLSSFGGLSVDSTSILVKYTYSGDADLDGDADGVDIGTWAVNFTGELGGTGTSTWRQGDWDYDGDVDGVDAGLWAQAFTGELGGGGLGSVVIDSPISPGAAAVLRSLGLTVVPEPTAASVLALACGVCVRRRRARAAAG
ncbi:MAG TPA: autotransporter-associated beta strand repeat-containing protein [Tepidisphaeraceae bacterium]